MLCDYALIFLALERELESCSGKFCFGDQLTIADICLVPQVYNARRFGVDMDKFPRIQTIDRALNELPEFKASHPDAQADCPEKKP